MSTGFIISLIVLYFFITRIIGSFFVNLIGPPIDDHDDGWIHLAMWVPIVGELGFLFVAAVFTCIACVEVVNRRTAKLATAIKKRLETR
mgnify:CR=1 FL=1